MCPDLKLCTNVGNCSIRGCLLLRWWAGAFKCKLLASCRVRPVQRQLLFCSRQEDRVGALFPSTDAILHSSVGWGGCLQRCLTLQMTNFLGFYPGCISEAIWLIYFVPNSIINTLESIIVWNRKSFWNRETSQETCDNGRDEFCILFYVIHNLRLHRRMLCFSRWSERPMRW